jgi:hypothetical protein
VLTPNQVSVKILYHAVRSDVAATQKSHILAQVDIGDRAVVTARPIDGLTKVQFGNSRKNIGTALELLICSLVLSLDGNVSKRYWLPVVFRHADCS